MKLRFTLFALGILFSININAQTSYSFDGINDYVTIPKNGTGVLNNFSVAHNFTIEIRFKVRSTPVGNAKVVSKHSSPADGWFIEFVGSTTALKAGMGRNWGYVTRTSPPLTIGTWYTAALAYDIFTNSFNYYIDGVLIGSATLPSTYYPETSYAIAIGKSLAWNEPSPIDVDFFRIWGSQQTASQLSANKSTEVSCSSTNLLLQYKFDDPFGSIVAGDCTSNSHDGSIFGATSALPVELISFDGIVNQNQAFLNWQTANEENNAGFEVQRLANGDEWETLDFVQGYGTTQEAQDYEYLDNNPLQGINYYRLKQLDFDGAYEYSDVIQVEFAVSHKKLALFPNPTDNELTVIDGEGVAIIYNALGQPVRELIINNEQLTIDVADLPKGQYILQVVKENGSMVNTSFVKQ